MPARKINHEQFVEMWNSNVPVKKIAEVFECSEWTVSKYADRHRDECLLRKKVITKPAKIDHIKFVEMWKKDVPVETMATVFGVTFDTICNYAGRHRSECPVRTFTPKNQKIDHSKFVELWNKNIPLKELAQAFDIGESYVSQYAKMHREECPARKLRKNSSEEEGNLETLIVDTSAINNPETFKMIENAKKVIIFSTVLRELNNLKDINHKEAKFTYKAREELRRVQSILKGCAFDTTGKYLVVEAESENNERNDETIARNAAKYKGAVVITCDYGLCCFCKLYRVKFLLLNPDVYVFMPKHKFYTKHLELAKPKEATIVTVCKEKEEVQLEEVKLSKSNLEEVKESCSKFYEEVKENPYRLNYELTEVNGSLVIKCNYGVIEITRKGKKKFINPPEKYQLFEGDEVTTKQGNNFKKRNSYIVVKTKGKLNIQEQNPSI